MDPRIAGLAGELLGLAVELVVCYFLYRAARSR
jgi:hypothetical protein